MQRHQELKTESEPLSLQPGNVKSDTILPLANDPPGATVSPVAVNEKSLLPAWIPFICVLYTPSDEALVPNAAERRSMADAFEATFVPSADIDEKWFTDYAVKACEEAIRNADYVDTKAEKFIGFVGAVSAAVLALLAKDAGVSPWLVYTASPAVLCALAAVRVALRVHEPREQFDLPGIRDALLQYGSEKSLGVRGFGAKLHQVREYERIIVDAKSALLAVAHKWALSALILLLAPMIVASAKGPVPAIPTPVNVKVELPPVSQPSPAGSVPNNSGTSKNRSRINAATEHKQPAHQSPPAANKP